MATVLALSSLVSRGHVGLSAITPALQWLGHEVIALPTILLSNHPGHPYAAGAPLPPEQLEAMLAALDANGWLATVDAVLTGYQPSKAHVSFAVSLVDLVKRRRPDALFFCDPVIGDTPPGLYIDPAAARAIRDELLPKAAYASPNAFELGWLSDRPVTDAASAIEAARALPVAATLVTSVPAAGASLANILVTEATAYVCVVPHKVSVPNGTGDFMMAVFVAECLTSPDPGSNPQKCLGRAVSATAALIAASAGKDELALVSAADHWHTAAPLTVKMM
ncbi:MAG: pyridoxal kinase [Hyphomicrobium sp.]|jgi:pyridoxine kinase